MKERAKALLRKNKNELPAARTLYLSLDRADIVIEGGPAFEFPGAVDENEGVVKRHVFAAMLCSTAWISEKVEDRSSETRTVNQFSAVVPPTIDSA